MPGVCRAAREPCAVDACGGGAVDAGVQADRRADVDIVLASAHAEHESRGQQSVAHGGGVIAGARETARDRGIVSVVAIGVDIKRVDVAGEVYFPIAGFDIDSGYRLRERT
jgi:hypothetical protein